MKTVFLHKRVGQFARKFDGSWEANIHGRGGETIAMEALPTWFLDQLEQGDFFEKKIGKSKCSSDDNFCKKIGREFSEKRMKLKRLTVESVNKVGGDRFLYLKDSDGYVYLVARRPNSKLGFFIDYWKAYQNIIVMENK